MDIVEQENVELREEITTLRSEMEMMSAQMASLVVAQNQPPPLSTPQATVIYEIGATPVSALPVSDPQHTMPEGYPWGMPLNVMEGFHFPTSGFPTSFVQHVNASP
ncbi:protein kinase super [Trifolium repens]|nr:protein kinase super [Trifolium repens]